MQFVNKYIQKFREQMFCLLLNCRYESKFIEEISVQLLNLTDLNVAKHPVGIKSRVRDVDNLLRAEKMMFVW